jgi:hypothetical protein
MFWGVTLLVHHYTMMMEVAWPSEVVSYHISMWCYNPENHAMNLYHPENLK